jgi:hypothetical protein
MQVLGCLLVVNLCQYFTHNCAASFLTSLVVHDIRISTNHLSQ